MKNESSTISTFERFKTHYIQGELNNNERKNLMGNNFLDIRKSYNELMLAICQNIQRSFYTMFDKKPSKTKQDSELSAG